MKFAVSRGVRGYLAVGVDPDLLYAFWQDIECRFDFFFGALAEDHSAPDATDGDGECGGRVRTERCCQGRRIRCALDQTIEICPHELSIGALRHISSEGEGLSRVVDGEDATNKAFGIFLFLSDGWGKMQCCAGKSLASSPR